jgi:hypothetical protein
MRVMFNHQPHTILTFAGVGWHGGLTHPHIGAGLKTSRPIAITTARFALLCFAL